ncbi:[FeFe] hydrogenase H-cluster maturation GTPase HydF [Peptoniphilus asaccharolyticus DSM 20463]|uniref:[FeFe] hydrogenase H-cluster maturation GTPase HydF n=1 Tax=Peptoniphilus asaccharolyticus DSM 20463 TaxID=573058 RepID=A0A1W1UV94_PEPAS|nr:[FeFe] hydrogenase H-cluster maturation GTPase HydF [Peptoniphilus asaccharolyticus]MBL7575240.1 [FeFe] hydrogenase H-cluster maturation GTPase HydF [Peptoniphilus asaccharolyticus]SMB85002.1 [FeFe] hydrogenase H-cluster maturation GTPase HydF [Peptoniphilus asaccharolyticus DSM 20463]
MEKEILDSKGMKTPKGNRIHIGIFGNTNSGKSTLVNLLTGQETSLVSNVSGTTTDPVYKPMEIQGVGATTLIDTAGFDDSSELGEKRMERTKKVLEECDILIYVERDNPNDELLNSLESVKKPLIKINNSNLKRDGYIKFNKEEILLKIREVAKDLIGERPLLDGLLFGGEAVVLVMPQDLQAPKGRLILPQVQTMRALLDLGCSVFSCKTDDLERTLNLLKDEPDMIITDSQVFAEVYKLKPENSKITSFSILMARAKGDIEELVKGANQIDLLNENSKVLISEACTHAPLEEDIGRIKIPKMLRAKYGEMQIDFSRGLDFPSELDYDLIIMCGSCMFNRARVMSRIQKAQISNIPVTNYGLTISKLKGILDKVEY